jgi:hypothetical protein
LAEIRHKSPPQTRILAAGFTASVLINPENADSREGAGADRAGFPRAQTGLHKAQCTGRLSRCTDASAERPRTTDSRELSRHHAALAEDYYSENFGALGHMAKNSYIVNGFQKIQA